MTVSLVGLTDLKTSFWKHPALGTSIGDICTVIACFARNTYIKATGTKGDGTKSANTKGIYVRNAYTRGICSVGTCPGAGTWFGGACIEAADIESPCIWVTDVIDIRGPSGIGVLKTWEYTHNDLKSWN